MADFAFKEPMSTQIFVDMTKEIGLENSMHH